MGRNAARSRKQVGDAGGVPEHDARLQAAHLDDPRERVGQRQEQQGRGARGLEDGREPAVHDVAHVREQVPVAELAALRPPGGAGGVDDGRQVGRVPRACGAGPPRRRRRRRRPRSGRSAARPAPGGRARPGRRVRRGPGRARGAVLDQPHPLAPGEPRPAPGRRSAGGLESPRPAPGRRSRSGSTRPARPTRSRRSAPWSRPPSRWRSPATVHSYRVRDISATRSPAAIPAAMSPLASAVTSTANCRAVTSCQPPSARRCPCAA